MLTQIDFDGELKLLEKGEDRESEPLQERWARLLAEEENRKYTGPEQRRAERRQKADRREMVRFQENSDRRSGKDRRKGIWDINHMLWPTSPRGMPAASDPGRSSTVPTLPDG